MAYPQSEAIAPTILRYHLDAKLHGEAVLLAFTKIIEPKECYSIIMNETLFHAQGGGQPSDVGHIFIKNASKSDKGCTMIKFNVEKVVFDRESQVVSHFGSIEKSDEDSLKLIAPGLQCEMHVDSSYRLLNSAIHTAGHLIDNIVEKAGLTLLPTKGYHFPDGPYVEYDGSIDENTKKDIIPVLQHISDDYLSKDIPVIITMKKVSSLEDIKSLVPPHLSPDSELRCVSIDGKMCPCGGTHLRTIKQMKKVTIKKITSKKKVVRVCYSVELSDEQPPENELCAPVIME